MANDEFILHFYENIALQYGDSSRSTMQDETVRFWETQFILEEIKDFIKTFECMPRILELGCGNGHLLKVIRQNFPFVTLFGVEFTPGLAQIAQQRNLPGCQVVCGDMRLKDAFPDKIDIVITERSLINLGSWKQQKSALTHITDCLNIPGRLIMVESFEEPWRELNRARKEAALDHIPQSPQNVYLKEKTARLLEHWGFFERTSVLPRNTLSTHFYHSRITHPAGRNSGAKTKFSLAVKFLDDCSPQAIGNYSPILFRTFDKTYRKIQAETRSL